MDYIKSHWKYAPDGPRWLSRLVRRIVRLAWLVMAVAIHHAWFDVGHRNWLLSGVDGIVLIGISYAIVWLLRDGPNNEVSDAARRRSL